MRYQWRHDSVLATLQPGIVTHVTTQNKTPCHTPQITDKFVTFVRTGEKKKKKKDRNNYLSLLHGAN